MTRRAPRTRLPHLLIATAAIVFLLIPAPARSDAPQPSQLIVAKINGEKITQEELARECLRHYGMDSMERFVNRYLIAQECERRGISVAPQEVQAKIERLAVSVGLSVDQLLQTLQNERGISAQEYADEIIWPMLALKKLGGKALEVTEDDLRHEYEKHYGPSVQVQIIACKTVEDAQNVRARVLADPLDFGNIAKNESIDAASACVKGLLNPIHHHVGDPAIEQAAFALAEGEISPVVPTMGQFVVLKCVRHLPSRGVRFEDVRQFLADRVEEEKANDVGQEIFRQLQEAAEVVNVMGDPEASAKMPGVAALINNRPVLLSDLAEQCVARHGEVVLEGYIGRRLLEQACQKHNIVITDQDINAEIARAAAAMLRPMSDGRPDTQGLIELMTRQQGITEDVYRSDSVWPTVALKKLVASGVRISEEDIQRGFESNYGPRVRCLAIALTDMRRAQQVWEMARNTPTQEYFGKLATEYSTDPGSAALGGEIPPIQRHGGQPTLEAEAFSLQVGEISSIVQLGPSRYAILLCLGHTDPVDVELADVREYIVQELHEKKMRAAMERKFQELRDQAKIENFLAGENPSHQQASRTTLQAAPQ